MTKVGSKPGLIRLWDGLAGTDIHGYAVIHEALTSAAIVLGFPA